MNTHVYLPSDSTALSLGADQVDLNLARQELTGNPLVSDYLVSKDGDTTAIVAMLNRNDTLSRDDRSGRGQRTVQYRC